MDRWMTKLPPLVTALPITQLAIPGSHDSGTLNLDSSLGVIEGSPRYYNFAKPIISNWAKTQDLSIAKQLQAGIRYFDLRVARRPGTNELRIVHTLYGRLVSEELQEVNNFLNAHPHEVVILDFNHLLNNMNVETHNRLLNNVWTTFGQKCTPPPDNDMWTLNNLRDKGHQVISLYDYDAIPQNHQTTVWQSNRIAPPWQKTDNLETLIPFLENNYNGNLGIFNNINQFYVWQGVLTPTWKTICLHPFSTLRDCLSLPATTAFVNWLRGKKNITICIVDFVEHNGFIKKVVDRNHI